MTPEEFRRNGYQLIDWIAEYLATVEQRPVGPMVDPGWVTSQLPAHPPAAPESFDAVMADMDSIVVPGLTQWPHPSFFAYFPANAMLSSVLGDLAAAGLAVNGMTWATGPSATEVETVVMDWMRELLALPETWIGNGVIQDSASSSTLVSILAARDQARARTGVPIDRLVGYSTASAHSSIEKGLRIAGIPAERFRVVAHDERFAMRPDALAAAIASDRDGGLEPFWVCAARGSTSSLAMDPVVDLVEVCTRERVWLHVDAAMAGIAALCPEHRWVNNGLDGVDSYVTDAHKWMGVNFDCSLFWVRDRAPLLDALSIQPAYLRHKGSDSGATIDYRDWQIPLGRRFRALKLWWVLRCEGVDALQLMLRNHVAWAKELTAYMEHDERFELVAPTDLNLVTFALRSGDEATVSVVESINASGKALMTKTVLDGRSAARVSVGNRLTEHRHVLALWDQLSALADTV
ncbi:MAG: pyridoxal-dependent decarboxylase [Acidimicrobiia bacterium]